jgi:uncharacterized membrane protein
MKRRILLFCGILAVVIYVATDIFAALRWEGYSYTDQTVSEFWAVDAPTTTLIMTSHPAFIILVIAFGLGLRMSAGSRRSLRIAGGLVIAIGIVDMLAPFAPMHQRQVLAAGSGTLTDTLHIVVGSLDVLLTLLIIGFGSSAFGRGFRFYSIATIALLLVFGALTGTAAPRLAANQPTPWLGIWERINIFGYMAWMVALAVGLLREQRTDTWPEAERRILEHQPAAGSLK